MKKKFYYRRTSKKSYIITIPTVEHGTITGPTVAYYGDKVTLTITPDSGYQLDILKVMCDDKEIAVTDGVFTMPDGNVEITATFKERVVEKYVDLGLPSGLRWATTNVGATNPEDYGNYYAWGETATKTTYDWSTYKYANGSHTALTKYCTNSYYGTVDNKTTLEAEDDAATANWGGNWRMPTIAEWEELLKNCTTLWTTINNVKCCEVKATNGNSIFLPAAGWYTGEVLNGAGLDQHNWSSSLDTQSGSSYAQYIYDRSVTHGRYRCYGLPVRPVLDPYKLTLTYDTAQGTATLSQDKAYEDTEITVNVTPSSGYELSSITVNGTAITGNTFTMPDSDVSVVVEFKSSAPSEYTITVNLSGGFGVVNYSPKAESGSTQDLVYTPDEGYEVGSVTIKCGSEIITPTSGYYKDSFIMPEGDVVVDVVLKEVEGVDLGGSVLWAPYNVGASKPTEYGDYFAWGETSPKTIYNWDSYEYCDGLIGGTYPNLTKYNTLEEYGTVDNLTTLEAADDAATANWGGEWRMPTKEEVEELLSNCTWTWTSNYKDTNVSGYQVAINSNTIFFPAAGRHVDSTTEGVGTYIMYWLNSIAATESHPDYGYELWGHSPRSGVNTLFRYYGYSIRPVKSKS